MAEHAAETRFARFEAQVREEPELQQQVTEWLIKNPPPQEWEASRLAWAFTEMPLPCLKWNSVLDLLLGRHRDDH